jgi:hypothetical protein
VIDEGGRLVSMAGFTADRVHAEGISFKVACIGSVVTLEECRGKGYATRIMDDCVERAREEGVAVLLISGGRGLYRRMGCIDAGSYRTARVPRRASSRLTTLFPATGLEAREWRREDVAKLAALQQREPVRFERSPDQFEALLKTGRLAACPGRTWVILMGGDVFAYCCAGDPVQRTGNVPLLEEIGGSRLALFGALPFLLGEYGAERIDIRFLGSDFDIGMLAGRAGLEVAPRGFGGTVRVIDPAAAASLLLDRARSFLPEQQAASLRADVDARGLTLQVAAETHRIDGLENLTALLFGSQERSAPVPARGAIHDLLASLLPIPLVDYGLNYI